MAHKILIVEDNEMNRDMLSRRLTRKGYEVTIAEDGAIGLDRMRSDRPDLVLMDMGLPVKDGWTATSEAKADPELASIPHLEGLSPFDLSNQTQRKRCRLYQ